MGASISTLSVTTTTSARNASTLVTSTLAGEPFSSMTTTSVASPGVPMDVFLIVLFSLLALLLCTSTLALGLWHRHVRLRKLIRSQRPSFLPDISNLQRRPLSENRVDVSEQQPNLM